jgi:actin-related protein
MRKTMGSVLLVSGGSTQFTGFEDRLLKELRPLAPPAAELRIISDAF